MMTEMNKKYFELGIYKAFVLELEVPIFCLI